MNIKKKKKNPGDSDVGGGMPLIFRPPTYRKKLKLYPPPRKLSFSPDPSPTEKIDKSGRHILFRPTMYKF